jgi:hypothetical protein
MRQNGSTFQYGNSFVSVANVDRCLNLIEILADNPPGIGLSSLADQLAMPLSAVHRLLGALIAKASPSALAKRTPSKAEPGDE